MPLRVPLVSLVLLSVACDRPARGGGAACGLAAVAGATTLLSQFTVANRTLSAPPGSLPERLVTRLVAGDAYPAVVGRTDSLLVIGVEGNPPPNFRAGFGVLVVDSQERATGVVLYEGDPVEGAPKLGEVSVGGASVPLLGVEADAATFEDPNCPFFPDSVIR